LFNCLRNLAPSYLMNMHQPVTNNLHQCHLRCTTRKYTVTVNLIVFNDLRCLVPAVKHVTCVGKCGSLPASTSTFYTLEHPHFTPPLLCFLRERIKCESAKVRKFARIKCEKIKVQKCVTVCVSKSVHKMRKCESWSTLVYQSADSTTTFKWAQRLRS